MRSAACNALHSADERCARWLLTTRDRTGRNEFPLTQEFLAAMLGVRRATATLSIGALRRAPSPARLPWFMSLRYLGTGRQSATSF